MRALGLAAAALTLACGREPAVGALELSGATMGTTYRLSVAGAPPAATRESLRRMVEPVLEAVDARMSTYREDSELSRFNASGSTDWFPVARDTLAVVREALRVSRETGGAFDPTVGPLVDLWGFGARARPPHPPAPAALATTLESVGADGLALRRSPPALRKRRPELRLDLSGIAKGFAVDRVAERLVAAGLGRHLVEVGGELRGRGAGPGARPWRVAIERPEVGTRRVQCVIRLEDRALATSGGYRRFFEWEGQRRSHIVDPRTGRPVTHSLASVSVLAPSALRADALATGLMVLGPEEGLELARRQGLAALFVVAQGDELVELRTPAFPACDSLEESR